MQSNISYLYNPASQTPENLIDNFIARQKEFKRIMRDIKQSRVDEVSQNFLITAQRGMGKTTLLLRLEYEVNATAELAHLIPIRFSEEQYNIVSFCNLWEVVADALEETEGFGGIVEQVERSIESDDESCFEPIKKALQKEGKKLLLLVDNFQDMLNKFTDNEIKELRDILHSTELQLVSASSIAIENTYHHDKPFFEFFKSIQLDGLSTTESQELFKKLAQNHPTGMQNYDASRIEIVKRLTGGVPRTMIIIFEIFLDRNAEIFENLEYILDQITPLYKHRMDDLTPQQQRIAHEIAIAWDGISFEELKKKTRTDEEELRGYLLELEKAYFIDVRSVGTTVDIYLLKERFFNIWYLMRNGNKNKNRVKWLVNFFEIWSTPEELKERALGHIQLVKEGKMSPRGALFMGETLASMVDDYELEYQVLKETKLFLNEQDENLADELEVKEDIYLFKQAKYFYKNKEYDKAIQIYEKAINLNPKYVASYNGLGIVYKKKEEYNKAIEYYNKAIDLDEKYAYAYCNLGHVYKNMKEYGYAIENYKKAIKIDNKYTSAYRNLGQVYVYQEKYDDAMKLYEKVLELDDKYIPVYNGLGNLYNKLEKYDDAIKSYMGAISIDVNYVYPYNNLGNLYEKLKEYDKAIQYYKKAIEVDENFIYPYNHLGNLYKKLKEYDNAIEYYKKAIEVDENFIYPYNNLGNLYKKLKEYDNAVGYYKKAIEVDENFIYPYNNLGNFYSKLKNYDDAIEYYKEAMNIKENDYKACNGLSWIYYLTNQEKVKSLELSQKSIENKKYMYNLHTHTLVQLWNNQYDESLLTMKEILESYEYLNQLDAIIEYFLLLIAKQQTQSLYKLFKEYPNLKNEFKPVYYTLMYFMQDEYPTEYQRMGAELEETVQEMVEEVGRLREKYGD